MPDIISHRDSLTEDTPRRRLQNVLVVTDAPANIQSLISQLRHRSLNVQLSYFDGAKLSALPVTAPSAIVCYLETAQIKASEIAKILKTQYLPKTLPVIGIVKAASKSRDSAFDSVIIQPAHPTQIASRVNSLIRLGAMEREIALRVQTLEYDFGETIHIEDDGKYLPFRVLFIGKPSPAFMVVVNALQERNVEIVAAFTSFSAFDYLHETSFDAVVMNALEQPEPALSISETMRRNSRLYNVPTLFIVDGNNFDYADKVYASGASDIIDIRGSIDEISGRVLELANYHRLHAELKHEFEKLGERGGVCEHTKCYTKTFMDNHARRVLKNTREQNIPLSFLKLELKPECSDIIEESYIKDAISRIGQVLKNLVRMQDTVSHYSPFSFLLMFPNTTAYETETILDRICALLECTAYESGLPNTALTMSLESEVVEADNNSSIESILEKLFHQHLRKSDVTSLDATYSQIA